MDPKDVDTYTLERLAGLVAGIPVGGVLGPLILGSLGFRNVAVAAAIGSVIGAVIGYILVSGFVSIAKRRRDRQLTAAADAVRREAGLPDTIQILVRGSHATLYGEVRYEAQRLQAEQAISALPGIRRVYNYLHFAPPAAA